MAGLAESQPSSGCDDFWGWRQLMYKFLERLMPDDAEAIAAFVQMEMLEADCTSVGEFHYLHHGQGSKRYVRLSEMSARIAAAAKSGIGLTLLPVLYERSGRREFDEWLRCRRRFAFAARRSRGFSDCRSGSARDGATAEQQGEVEEVEPATERGSVEWLLEHVGLNRRWCLIHCTHMTDPEAVDLANPSAVADVYPITESNLGDGIFNGIKYLGSGGSIAVGTDSNVQVTQADEFRTLEYSQCLSSNCRSALAARSPSTGRSLLEACAEGGAKALGLLSGQIASGVLADLVEVDGGHANLQGLGSNKVLDAWIFAEGHGMVRTVWSTGRKLVRDGIHIRRNEIEAEYRKINGFLRDAI